MSEILEKLFGSKVRSRILRFFLFNPDQDFTADHIAKKNMLRLADTQRELLALTKLNYLKGKKRKGQKLYTANEQFNYFSELKGLFAKANAYPQCRSLEKLRGIGNVRLALAGGVFVNYTKGRIDLLLVGDDIDRKKLETAVRHIEAEIGKEIRYMLLPVEEMTYRMNMMDRFLIEFLRAPYDEVINKMPDLQNFIEDFRK